MKDKEIQKMNLYFSLSFIEQRNNDFIIRITKRGHGGPHNDLREKKKTFMGPSQ